MQLLLPGLAYIALYMLGRVRGNLPSLGKPSPVLPDVVERKLNPSRARSNRDVLNPPATGLLVSE